MSSTWGSHLFSDSSRHLTFLLYFLFTKIFQKINQMNGRGEKVRRFGVITADKSQCLQTKNGCSQYFKKFFHKIPHFLLNKANKY